jgi:hypothetical protein
MSGVEIKLVSPNSMLEAAKDIMLDGREPETREDWAVVMNFFAANIQVEVALSACKLLVKIYHMPLSDDEVKEIVEFQLARRNGH